MIKLLKAQTTKHDAVTIDAPPVPGVDIALLTTGAGAALALTEVATANPDELEPALATAADWWLATMDTVDGDPVTLPTDLVEGPVPEFIDLPVPGCTCAAPTTATEKAW